MSAESDLYASLSAHAPLVAIVSDRIWPDVIPEGATLPAVVYARVSTEPVVSVSGRYFGDDASMLVQCWANDRDSADACADAVSAALRSAGHSYTGRSGGYDSETGLYLSAVDARVMT